MNRTFAKLSAIIFMIIICAVSAFAVDVYIDDKKVEFTAASGSPFIHEGRTLVPLRVTMESYGATVEWEASTKTAIVRKDTTTVRCKIGEKQIYRNNVKILNDASAVIQDGRTYLPIRAVLEAFGAAVGWNGSVIVTSPGAGGLIELVEKTPPRTSNFWKGWVEALALKDSGNYSGAIDKILSVSSLFISKSDSASNAMLYKHLGECYSKLKDYEKASACFKRESYYWSKTSGMDESRRDAERRAGLIKTGTQVYIRSSDEAMGARTYFAQQHEPHGGVLLGAYAEGDTNIYNPYSPDKFYMDSFPKLVERDIGAYLLYLPYGMDISHYNSHLERAKNSGKVLQIALEPHQDFASINDKDGYLINLAKHMENSGCRLLLRFAGEMNDTTSEWFTKDTELYKEKFRLVARVFHEYAPSVPIIWAPNFYPADTIDDYYPGDEYVDYVGISSYMMHQPITDPLGEGVDRSRWSNQLDVLYSLYGHKKPIIIVEGGASYMDYDTWADITPFASRQLKDFYTYLPIKYPNVKYCFIFDSDRERQKFSLSNNNEYLTSYKQGTASDLYPNSLDDAKYTYDYYEIGNNVSVKAESTVLCSYITTPSNDTSLVSYYINDVFLGSSASAPYSVPVDFSSFRGQKVKVNVVSYDAHNSPVTSYTISINVI